MTNICVCVFQYNDYANYISMTVHDLFAAVRMYDYSEK